MNKTIKRLLWSRQSSVGKWGLNVRTSCPSISQCPPHQKLTACERMGKSELGGWVVIGFGYQRVDEALRAPTCLLSVHEGEYMTCFSPSSHTRASFPYMHTMTQQWIYLTPVLYSEKIHQTVDYKFYVVAGILAWCFSSMTFWKPKVIHQGTVHVIKVAFVMLSNAVCENKKK